jgi:hypothetical protein
MYIRDNRENYKHLRYKYQRNEPNVDENMWGLYEYGKQNRSMD